MHDNPWPSAPPHDPYHDPCHEPGDCYDKKTFYRIVKDGSEHAKEVGTNCHYFQFPGQGQKVAARTDLDIDDELITWLL